MPPAAGNQGKSTTSSLIGAACLFPSTPALGATDVLSAQDVSMGKQLSKYRPFTDRLDDISISITGPLRLSLEPAIHQAL